MKLLYKLSLFIFLTQPFAAAQGTDITAPVNLLVGIDSSGSLKTYFPAIQHQICQLMEITPIGSHIVLLRFDEEVEEIARTDSLEPGQRETIQERINKIKPTGRWTDFQPAVEQIVLAAKALGRPLLIVCYTDALSDPAPGKVFQNLDRLLSEQFNGQSEVAIQLVVPDPVPPSQYAETDWVQTVLLREATPEMILATLPSPSPVAVVQKEPGSAMPRSLILMGAGTVPVVIALLILYWCDRKQAEEMKIPHSITRSSKSFEFNLQATWGNQSVNLGPINELKAFRIGTALDCDVQIPSLDHKEIEVRVYRQGARWSVSNYSEGPIQMNGTAVIPGQQRPLRWPTQIYLEKATQITLALVPKRQEYEQIDIDELVINEEERDHEEKPQKTE